MTLRLLLDFLNWRPLVGQWESPISTDMMVQKSEPTSFPPAWIWLRTSNLAFALVSSLCLRQQGWYLTITLNRWFHNWCHHTFQSVCYNSFRATLLHWGMFHKIFIHITIMMFFRWDHTRNSLRDANQKNLTWIYRLRMLPILYSSCSSCWRNSFKP